MKRRRIQILKCESDIYFNTLSFVYTSLSPALCFFLSFSQLFQTFIALYFYSPFLSPLSSYTHNKYLHLFISFADIISYFVFPLLNFITRSSLNCIVSIILQNYFPPNKSSFTSHLFSPVVILSVITAETNHSDYQNQVTSQ